jgi:ribosomal protein S12 methylthiotransferase
MTAIPARPPRKTGAEPVASVHFHSLGCAKNLLDTEVMIGTLAQRGYAIAERLEDADAVVVNTCSFIEAAREESIAAILDVAELREEGALRALVVAGCLPQRYGAALAKELPEVDAFVGTGDFPKIADILDEALAGSRRGIYVDAGRTHLYDETTPRVLVGPTHSAYLKVAEGCDRVCAFCAIPGIRGRFQSRPADSVVAEARQLAAAGVREVNVISQDTTSWGKDQPGRPALAELVRRLDAVQQLDWIRLLYLYPSAISDELIDAIAAAERVLPYVDVPLQHASDRILRAMRRGTTQARQRELVRRLRDGIPNLTLRTTLIVGFPGEREQDFAELCDFVRDVRFDRVGVFRYSDEETTAAFDHAEKVPRTLARERYDALGEILSGQMTRASRKQIGSECTVLVDAGGRDRAVGRSAAMAPEIDGNVLLNGAAATGELVRARIVGAKGVDLEAEVLEREDPVRSLDAYPEVGRSSFAQKIAPQ